MNDTDIILDAMRGARFDEFRVRKASASLILTQGDGVDAATYVLETCSHISPTVAKAAEYETTSPDSAKLLYDLLESNLLEITKVDSKTYRVKFDGDVIFYISDFDDLWDNVFSVRVSNWPTTGDRGSYFF